MAVPPAPAWAQHAWWLAAVGGAVTFVLLSKFAPGGRQEAPAWVFVLKLFAFGCVSAAIALAPWVRERHYWLLYGTFLALTGLLIPRISFFYFVDTERLKSESFYTHLYVYLYPLVLLTVVAAFRIGGGSPGRCLKIAATGMALIFSGFLDIMWWAVNPIPLPREIDAPHINAFTGGPIPLWGAILFACAHIPVIVLINKLPLDRWLVQWRLAPATVDTSTSTSTSDEVPHADR